LRVAREAFSQLGYAGASMGDIAARAGIRKSSLFHHFATKDELYREALSGILADLGAHVKEALEGGGPILERMAKSNRAVQQYLGKNPVAARLLLREFVDGGNAIAAAGDAAEGILRASQSLLEQGMNEGIIPRQDPRHLVMSTAGIHILFFALPELTSRLFGADVFGTDIVDARCEAALVHVQRVLGTK
jgi:AcrR family transcriptional regulator